MRVTKLTGRALFSRLHTVDFVPSGPIDCGLLNRKGRQRRFLFWVLLTRG